MTARRTPLGDFHPAAEVARRFGVSVDTVARWITSGLIEATNVATRPGDVRWRISDRAIAEFAEARSRAALSRRAAS